MKTKKYRVITIKTTKENETATEKTEMSCPELTNEEYRDKLRDIFDGIEDNRKLRFWYTYISKIEKG
jgi:hypothetical protein